ncbi:MAG: EAL domain-containing protein [Devosia sp.]|uniref:putative bifunctional diguanylate cyclase/phosphodiesterase n=1 Tax=unclassified Devosia TaxID=196773 RepID=UPI0019F18A98|nr:MULTISPECIES: EAL domain-containing protein [unclassified Devosia]MBF0680271.1 EAL domain-containing protein [Devosia sp.]WEJ33466.1 EAL domain-containing protein [Devosia sp. SD17-2]
MLISARKTMPALDYVSLIRSVYGDRRALLAGACASAGVAAMSGIKADAPALYLVALIILLVGIARFVNMRAFWDAAIGNEDANAAEHWENRALWGGALVALAHGLWCLVAILFVQDPFAELAACTLSIASTVGMVARNFALDRLITIQTVALSVPLWVAMLLRADIYHALLAAMLLVMLISFRKLAADIRVILISALHGRIEVSRLAAELDIAITTLAHGLCMLDENGIITVANSKANRTFARLGIFNLTGRPFTSVLAALETSGKVPRTAIDRLRDMITRPASGKVLLALGPGIYFEVTISARKQRCVLLFEDISERVAAEERISFMAHHDTLTDLPNRSHFNQLATDELESRAKAGQASALMVVDVDEFKHVNDTYGHVVGDTLLRQVALRLRRTVPPHALVARLGGDEFVVLTGHEGDDASVVTIAETIRRAFTAPFLFEELTLNVNISIGLATAETSDISLEELMTKADLALYAAKSAGKGHVQLFHAQMDIDYHYRQRLKSDLRTAIARRDLTLAFQPLFDIETRRVVSCEALARWVHPELGNIGPNTFIPLAEEIGLISDITAFMIESATREAVNWRGGIGVAINISARDFRGLDLPALVDRALAASGLEAHRLELEVTESALIEEKALAQSVLMALAERGVSIALDDFGTGYSSLSYLNALPLTKLKIDKSFVTEIARDARALSLLTGVARIGRDLDLTVVAEGVETQLQFDTMLAHTSVQQVQGYLFSRPLPAADIAELISRLNAAPPRQITNVVNAV